MGIGALLIAPDKSGTQKKKYFITITLCYGLFVRMSFGPLIVHKKFVFTKIRKMIHKKQSLLILLKLMF